MNHDEQPREVLVPAEVAELLGLSETEVLARCRDRRLPAGDFDGSWRLPRRVVVAVAGLEDQEPRAMSTPDHNDGAPRPRTVQRGAMT